MVLAPKDAAQGRIGGPQQVPTQVHGDLPGLGDPFVEQFHLGDADRGSKAGADRAEIVDDVVALGRPPAQVGHGDREIVASTDDDVPVLRDRPVEFLDEASLIDHAGLDRILLGVGMIVGDGGGDLGRSKAGPLDRAFAQAGGDRFRAGPAVGE